MKKIGRIAGVTALALTLSTQAFAALESRFDAINFTPAVDGGDYLTVYGSDTLAAGQGHVGFYLDYANRPLQFSGTGGFVGLRQSVIDHAVIMNTFGSIGVTDWFSVGLNVPVVFYNWFFSDTPIAAPTGLADKGGGVGDITVVSKFRLLDINKYGWGIALVPYFTLPSGDVTRYNGSGHVTGGGTFVTEVAIGERFNMSLNLGAVIRDDVTRHGIRIDDQLTAGLAANIKISQDWQAIIETYGSTVMRDFLNTGSTPLEAGATIRHYFGDTGLSADLGGSAGIIDGIGSPRFRVMAGLKYTSPIKEECAPPPPDPRIQGNKIVLWGKIFYDTNKTTIKPISFPVLDDVVDVMQKHPEITLVEVQGHTDARASDTYNLRLSQGRADSAMNYLISKGISSSRLRSKGYGESMPIASNTTAEGMSQNRRTEFVIVSNAGNVQQQQVNNLPNQQYIPNVPNTGYTQPVPTPVYQAEPSAQNMATPVAARVVEDESMVQQNTPAPVEPGEYPNYSYPPAPTGNN